MDEDSWADVDAYLVDTLHADDPALDDALRASHAAGLPSIAVAPNQGKLLHLLARMARAKRILEIGTLGGYSAIWLARALPADGELVTLEFDPKHAEVARQNLDRAGVGPRVQVKVGPALDSLPTLRGPFDLVFIDADKVNNADYLAWAVKLARPGSVIVLDNVVREGEVLDASSREAAVVGTRRALEAMGRDPRLDATAVQTVGSKGWDGFAVALVR